MKSLADIAEPFSKRLEKVDWTAHKNKPSADGLPDLYLFMKWAYRVEKGWYGFALGNVPMVWAMLIDEFLTELEKEAPDFKIHQIKLKFGGLRFYVDLGLKDNVKAEAIHHEIDKLTSLLHNENLIY
jgi:hypothetical protein